MPDFDWSRYRNFDRHEFKCPCCNQSLMMELVVMRLQLIRDVHGPIIITSGYRCEAYNGRLGGHPNSDHMFGKAVDFVAPKSRPENMLESMRRHFNGIGVRTHGPEPYWHGDLGDGESFWTYR